MHLPMFRVYGDSLLCIILALATMLVSTNSVSAFPGIGAGENPWADMSRTPFELQMSGVINPETEGAGGDSIAVVTLGIGQYHETYKFEIVKLESPPNPQLSPAMILQKQGKRQYDFELIGPAELLSKVAQAEPGTPLKIVGMYQQRGQRLELVSVDVVGMDKN